MRSLSLILGLLIAAPLSADEVRLVDGTVIVGLPQSHQRNAAIM